ncbi:hypothetical protein [Peteryoungia desertarenae]|nr:hypothetical protein [Peteryoungia desertarenae]
MRTIFVILIASVLSILLLKVADNSLGTGAIIGTATPSSRTT